MLKRYPKLFGFLTALVGVVFYVFWSGFDVPLPDTSSLDIKVESIGDSDIDSVGNLNVLAFAPALTSQDYASLGHLSARLRPYFEAAKNAGVIGANTIVLLPAHTLTPLLFTGYGSRVYNARSLGAASMPIIAQNLIEFTKNYFIFDAERPMASAFVRTQTKTTADAIQTVFGGLAKEYGVYIVPGSGLLMTPGVHPNALSYGHGPIFHTSFMFDPDGKAKVDAVRKIMPTAMLDTLVKPSLPEFLPVFEIAGAKIMVVIEGDIPTREQVDSTDLILATHYGRGRTAGNNTPIVAISSNASTWQHTRSNGEVTIIGKDDAANAMPADINTIYNITF